MACTWTSSPGRGARLRRTVRGGGGLGGPGGLDSGSAYSSSSCPCGVGWEVRAGELLMGRVVVGPPPRWREQRSRSRGEAVVGEA